MTSSEPMLSAAEEAEFLGVHQSTVSRARADPDHPVHSGASSIRRVSPGRIMAVAPRSLIQEYWSRKEAKRNHKTDRTKPPELTKVQWDAVRGLSEGKGATGLMLSRLTAAGWCSPDGKLTAKAWKHLNPHV